MQNFDDFENFSSNQNLKEVFQAVFDFADKGKAVAQKVKDLKEIHEASDRLEPETEPAFSAEPETAEPAFSDEVPETQTVEMREEDARPKAEPIAEPTAPAVEPIAEAESGETEISEEAPSACFEQFRFRNENAEPERTETREQAACCVSERRLREFYFGVQRLYFVLEQGLDRTAARMRARSLCELTLRVLRILRREYARCFGGGLAGHFDPRANRAVRAGELADELLLDASEILETCGGAAPWSLVFSLLSCIAARLA